MLVVCVVEEVACEVEGALGRSWIGGDPEDG